MVRLGGLALVLACTVGTGCVQRRLTIRSNPPGALVRIDNHDIGITPCSTDYIYYGKRHIQLVRDGYQTVDDYRWVGPPWYEIPPLDLFSENAIPWEIRDERTFEYDLMRQQVIPTQQLLGRAENLRTSTHLDAAAAAPPAPPPGTVISGPPGATVPIPGDYPAGPAPLNAPRGYPVPGYQGPGYPVPASPVPGYPAPGYPIPASPAPSGTPPRSFPLPSPNASSPLPPLSNSLPPSAPGGYPRQTVPLPPAGPR
ncbi:MAG TPA: PEGA domain-containing protein [Pirellulales bacterium]|nr:PEGA domain-containing protein [Pirellulales bacterium]